MIIFFLPIFLLLKTNKKFDEKNLLIIFNIILAINLLIFIKLENKKTSYFVIFGIITIFCDTSIESLINILYHKIFPSNLFLCKINIKKLISVSTISGKIIGGIFYFILYFCNENQRANCFNIYFYFIFISSIFMLFFNIIFNNDLKITALNKLILMED